jgi:hypothetical protein
MKLNEILDTSNYNEVVDTIKNDCFLFLKNSGPDQVLYRGVGGKLANEKIKLNVISELRNKSYSSFEATKELDKLMKNDGFSATRMNLFTSSRQHNAKMFGPGTYVVFPVGEYELTYYDAYEIEERFRQLDEIPDLMSYGYSDYADLGDNKWNRMATTTEYEYNNYMLIGDLSVEEQSKIRAKLFWEKYGDLFMKGQDVKDAVKYGSEVYVNAKSVHMIEVGLFNQKFKDLLWR